MNVSKAIKMATIYAGKTQTEIAKKIGVTPSNFSQKVIGDPRTSDLIAIAGAMGAELSITFNFRDGKQVG